MLQQVKRLIGLDKPDPDMVSWANLTERTPDHWKLEQTMFQLVFVPDDMMTKKINNGIIKSIARNETPVHPACFTMERYYLFKKDLGIHSFPIAMERKWEPQDYHRVKPIPAKIKGELYAVFSPRMIELDNLKQNGVQFRRIRTLIHLPYNEVTYSKSQPLPKISKTFMRTVEAHMYVGVEEYWGSRIGDLFGISECDHYRQQDSPFWLDIYYKFE